SVARSRQWRLSLFSLDGHAPAFRPLIASVLLLVAANRADRSTCSLAQFHAHAHARGVVRHNTQSASAVWRESSPVVPTFGPAAQLYGALTAGLQKVSGQLELSKSAPQVVLNN